MKYLNRILYIFLFILSFLIIGGSTLLTGEMGFGALKDTSFYINQLITDAAIMLITLGTVYLVIDRFKETNLEFKEIDQFIIDFAKDKRNIPSFISRFLEKVNRKRKIAQYKFNLHKRLHLLINYKPWYWVLFPWNWGKKKYSDEDLHIWNYGTQEEKLANEYCKKRYYLEEQLQENFIENNIDSTYVKYQKVTESVILGGYYTDPNKKGPNEFIEPDITSKILLNKTPKLMIGFGFTFLASSIVFENFVINTGVIVSLSIKLLVLIWNAFLALRYGNNLCKTVIIKDMRFRKGLIIEYDKWLKQEADAQAEAEAKAQIQVEKEEIVNNGTN